MFLLSLLLYYLFLFILFYCMRLSYRIKRFVLYCIVYVCYFCVLQGGQLDGPGLSPLRQPATSNVYMAWCIVIVGNKVLSLSLIIFRH